MKRPFSLTDLIRDDDFIDWVRQPTSGNTEVWEAYLLQFPDQKQTVGMARDYVRLIAENTGKSLPTNEQSEKMWLQIVDKLNL